MHTRTVLTEAQKDELTRAFRESLDKPNFREWVLSPAREVTKPDEEFKRYESSGTIYWLIATGPELDRESTAVHLLAADVEKVYGC